MRQRRSSYQLARIAGIRIGAGPSWFVVLFLLIYWLAEYFNAILASSQTTIYVIAVAGALGYFLSLVLHELGHALVARRLGIGIAGIDLWFFGGLSKMKREPASAGEEFKIAAAGPAVTLLLLAACVGVGTLIAGSSRFTDVALTKEHFTTTPALALAGWLGFVNAFLLVFNIIPAFPLDGGRIARAAIWARTGDRNRATQATGRAGQALALALALLALLTFSSSHSVLDLLTLFLAFILFQTASGAVVQGTIGRRIQGLRVGDIMDRTPVTIPSGTSLVEAHEQFFLPHSWPWFAVVDERRRFLGVVRLARLETELAAGRPALAVEDALETDLAVQIGEEAPLESLLGAEGLGRLGAMVAVDGEGVLQGVVTIAQIRRALAPAS